MAALDYLAIQGSAVPSERVFSSAKETMTDQSNRIHEDLMEMLQMLKFAFKTGKPLDFMQETSGENIIAHFFYIPFTKCTPLPRHFPTFRSTRFIFYPSYLVFPLSCLCFPPSLDIPLFTPFIFASRLIVHTVMASSTFKVFILSIRLYSLSPFTFPVVDIWSSHYLRIRSS